MVYTPTTQDYELALTYHLQLEMLPSEAMRTAMDIREQELGEPLEVTIDWVVLNDMWRHWRDVRAAL